MKYKLIKREHFYPETATEETRYYLYYLGHSIFWRPKWKQMVIWDGAFDMHFSVAGDIEWAKKVAKHYEIEVPA